MTDGNVIDIDPPEPDGELFSVPDQPALVFCAQAVDRQPSESSEAMRAKARALAWLADLLEEGHQGE